MGKLAEIQSKLKAPKSQYNKFGGYAYRSCEDILEALKPLLLEAGADLVLSDEAEAVGNRVYIRATATFRCGDETAVGTGVAREADSQKGMSDSQITGTASSYARKYALNGLFLIDDTKDDDTNEARTERESRAAHTPKPSFTKEQIEEMKKWNDGTFTAEELAKFKAKLSEGEPEKKFEAMKAEYARRKTSHADDAGASKAFDIF